MSGFSRTGGWMLVRKLTVVVIALFIPISLSAAVTLKLATQAPVNSSWHKALLDMELFKQLNDNGTTIVQVTHSETNAAYGSRIIKLRDGFIDLS